MMSLMQRYSRWIAVVLLFAMLPMVVGCYGRFPLTKKLYAWNGQCSDNKFVKSLVMWVMVIIPVYGICTFVDAIVINLVEFWFGTQLVAMETTDAQGRTLALTPGANENEAILTLSRDGQMLSRHHFVRVDGRMEVRDDQGVLRGQMIKGENGNLLFTDAEGRTVQVASMASLATIGH